MHARAVLLRETGYSWKEIGEALNRHPNTTKCYCREWERELEYADTIHFYLSEKTRKLLQKLEVDTMAHSGAVQAKLIASSYFEGHRWKGVGPATVKEILDAIEDLYDSRANRRQLA